MEGKVHCYTQTSHSSKHSGGDGREGTLLYSDQPLIQTQWWWWKGRYTVILRPATHPNTVVVMEGKVHCYTQTSHSSKHSGGDGREGTLLYSDQPLIQTQWWWWKGRYTVILRPATHPNTVVVMGGKVHCYTQTSHSSKHSGGDGREGTLLYSDQPLIQTQWW